MKCRASISTCIEAPRSSIRILVATWFGRELQPTLTGIPAPHQHLSLASAHSTLAAIPTLPLGHTLHAAEEMRINAEAEAGVTASGGGGL